jgi:hypothetical protein
LSVLRSFGVFHRHSVYFVDICHFGMLQREQSGNPVIRWRTLKGSKKKFSFRSGFVHSCVVC